MTVEHFTLDEFVASTTAARLGLSNALPVELVPSAWRTLAMLERIRGYLCLLAGRDVSVVITSGYRSAQVNAAVGGGKASDHLQALAADIRAPAFGTPGDVAMALAPQVSVLGIGQLALEFPGPHAWVHVSTRVPSKAVNRIITIDGRGTLVGVHP